MKPLTLGIFQVLSPASLSGVSWLHPDNRETEYLTLDFWTSLGRRLDEAGLDFLFLADQYGYPLVDGRLPDVALEGPMTIPIADPFSVVSAIAAVTETLGLVVTSSTVFEPPYANARRFATLDHLSGGRIGWNIVTSAGAEAAAAVFGTDMVPHDRRYDMADDYVELTYKFLESWAPDAVRRDRVARVYADPRGVHEVHHDGPYYRSHGLFPTEPSPQRVPTLFQAGSSGRGREFAARHAECVFMQGTTVERVAAGVADIRARAVSFGRGPDAIRILVGLTLIVGRTEDEARGKYETFCSFATDEVAAAQYAWNTGIDLLKLDPDRPLPAVTGQLGQSNVERYQGEDAPTVREILDEMKIRGLRGLILVGTPERVVDDMVAYVEQTGIDGYLLEWYLTPGTYDELIDLVLPVLRARGLAPAARGTSLRDRLFGAGDHLPADHPGAAFRAPPLAADTAAAPAS